MSSSSEPPQPEVGFVAYVVEKKSGETKRYPLVLQVTTAGVPHERSVDVDVVVPGFLTACGWTMHPAGVATAMRVGMFLVRQLGHLKASENVWKRILPFAVPPAVQKNVTWQTSLKYGVEYEPEFWRRLFKEVECRLNPKIAKTNPVLNLLSQMAKNHGVNPASHLLAFAFLKVRLSSACKICKFCKTLKFIQKTLEGHNLADVLRYQRFQKYMFGGSVGNEIVYSLTKAFGAMQVVNNDIYEDAWVLLLASSFFRKFPLVERAADEGNFPVLYAKILDDQKRRLALEEERRRLAVLKEEADTTVGAEAPAAVGDPHKLLIIADQPPADPSQHQQQSAPAVAVMNLPPYFPYPSPPDEQPDRIVALVQSMEAPVAIGPKALYLQNVGRDVRFSALSKKYCEAGELNSFANPLWLLRSVGTCLLGGDNWQRVHHALLPAFGELPRPTDMRRAIGDADMETLVDLLNLTDNEGVAMIPSDVQQYIQMFSMEVGPLLKYQDKVNLSKTCIKMMLVMYFDQWAATTKKRFSTVDLWRDVYTWSYDSEIADVIGRWKAAYPLIPTPIKAYALRLVHSVA